MEWTFEMRGGRRDSGRSRADSADDEPALPGLPPFDAQIDYFLR